MQRLIRLLITSALLAALAGCASSGGVGGGAQGGGTGSGAAGPASGPGGAETYGTGPGGGLQGQVLGGPAATLPQRVVYFDYDSADIRADSRPLVEAHAEYLANHPQASVILEGHADERGTREYNIALGERRAQTVRRVMVLYGVAPQQIRAVSYGEERPAVAGNDESAWSQNRRVEIVY